VTQFTTPNTATTNINSSLALNRSISLYVNEMNQLIHVNQNATSATTSTNIIIQGGVDHIFLQNYNNFSTELTNYLITRDLMFEPYGYVNTAVNGAYFTSNVSGLIQKARKGPLIKKSIKSSIKRALKLMTGLGFEEDLKLFLGGGEIEISHPESLFKFIITKYSNSLIHYTERPGRSIPFSLALYTKTNVHISNLCVYMEDTPILDQVLGVAMFIKSGSEEHLLRKANFFRLSSDQTLKEELADQVPFLRDKLRLPLKNSGIILTP